VSHAEAARDVSVLVFDRGVQKAEICKSITGFSLVTGGPGRVDYKDRFVGCRGTGVPFGRYHVRFIGDSLAPNRDFDCVVTAERSACIITADRGDVRVDQPMLVSVRGVRPEDKAILIFRSVFPVETPWSSAVSVGPDMQTSIQTDWLDLTVTAVVNGEVIGTASMDRRRSLNRFTVSIDPVRRVLSAEPETPSTVQ
jgi:hypothetical protein